MGEKAKGILKDKAKPNNMYNIGKICNITALKTHLRIYKFQFRDKLLINYDART